MAYSLGFEPTAEEPYFFISYKRTDRKRIAPITKLLADNGIPMWYDQDIQSGTEWEAVLAERIRNSVGVLLFVSRHIFEKTNTGDNYVQLEYKVAKRYGKGIIPVFIDQLDSHRVPPEYAFWYEELAAIQGVAADESVNQETAVRSIYNRLETILQNVIDVRGGEDAGGYVDDEGCPDDDSAKDAAYDDRDEPEYPRRRSKEGGAKAAVPVVIIGAAVIIVLVMMLALRRNRSGGSTPAVIPGEQGGEVTTTGTQDAEQVTTESPEEVPQETLPDESGVTSSTENAEAANTAASADPGTGEVTPDENGTGDETVTPSPDVPSQETENAGTQDTGSTANTAASSDVQNETQPAETSGESTENAQPADTSGENTAESKDNSEGQETASEGTSANNGAQQSADTSAQGGDSTEVSADTAADGTQQ